MRAAQWLCEQGLDAVNVSGFGLGHDGTGSRHFLPTIHFYELDELIGQDFKDVSAFLMCFNTGTAPVVGYNRTVSVMTAGESNGVAELNLAEGQARIVKTCDLVARGRVGGALRQFHYDRASARYRSDRSVEPPRTRDELISLLGSNDALTFLAVLPGSGPRLGGDRDEDGVLDSDAPTPLLNLASGPSQLLLSWPETSVDWLLERRRLLDGPWQPDLSPRSQQEGLRHVEHSLSEESMGFFRLRRVW